MWGMKMRMDKRERCCGRELKTDWIQVYPSKDYLKTYLARMEEIGWRDRKLEVLDEVEGFRIDRIEKDSEV